MHPLGPHVRWYTHCSPQGHREDSGLNSGQMQRPPRPAITATPSVPPPTQISKGSLFPFHRRRERLSRQDKPPRLPGRWDAPLPLPASLLRGDKAGPSLPPPTKSTGWGRGVWFGFVWGVGFFLLGAFLNFWDQSRFGRQIPQRAPGRVVLFCPPPHALSNSLGLPASSALKSEPRFRLHASFPLGRGSGHWGSRAGSERACRGKQGAAWGRLSPRTPPLPPRRRHRRVAKLLRLPGRGLREKRGEERRPRVPGASPGLTPLPRLPRAPAHLSPGSPVPQALTCAAGRRDGGAARGRCSFQRRIPSYPAAASLLRPRGPARGASCTSCAVWREGGGCGPAGGRWAGGAAPGPRARPGRVGEGAGRVPGTCGGAACVTDHSPTWAGWSPRDRPDWIALLDSLRAAAARCLRLPSPRPRPLEAGPGVACQTWGRSGSARSCVTVLPGPAPPPPPGSLRGRRPALRGPMLAVERPGPGLLDSWKPSGQRQPRGRKALWPPSWCG
ncbi:uncharacterized protein LOC106998107 isoform X1 [Macaca mulatta]